MFDATLGMTMDATGYENIWICGRLWGLTPAEVAGSIDNIAEFTELGDYLKVPVRTYSTGMMLRLAFAIATVRQPEILLLDEIIGVGDAAFFAKAFSRLQNVVARSKILFVASHADDILRLMCDKAIWLDHGSLVAYDDIDSVLAEYRKQSPDPKSRQRLPRSEVAQGLGTFALGDSRDMFGAINIEAAPCNRFDGPPV